ncbi:MAG: type II toxin-antitoxin system VapC family toxin [Acidobacteria bacterium]|nr:type II toxin-antitoxin system VapC family toxin [Acidobacteriota bacterium]MCW5970504.1 type II toxin-antitoxin system VapC family toxin [Blastocatellales bacterium]
MKYVVDASLAVKWYVPEVHSDAAERLLDPVHELCAPDLIVPEFGNIVWKKIARRELTELQGRNIIAAFTDVPFIIYPTAALLKPAFEGAVKSAQTVYDWMYLALAVSLGCRMATADEKFYRAVSARHLAAHLCWVADIS